MSAASPSGQAAQARRRRRSFRTSDRGKTDARFRLADPAPARGPCACRHRAVQPRCLGARGIGHRRGPPDRRLPSHLSALCLPPGPQAGRLRRRPCARGRPTAPLFAPRPTAAPARRGPAGGCDGPATPQALCGKRVASIKGASWTPKLHKVTRELCQPTGRRAIEVLEFPSSPEALMALRSQAADAMMEDAAVAHAMLAQTNNAVKLSSTALLYPVVIGLGRHRDARQLQGQLQQALDQARASGEYAALLSRYGLQPPAPADIEAALAVPPK